MPLYSRFGELVWLPSEGAFGGDSECCCEPPTECDWGDLETLMGIYTIPRTATLTVTYPSCTPVDIFHEDCSLNSVSGFTLPYDPAISGSNAWSGSAIGRAGQYQCNAGPAHIAARHTVTVKCDETGVVIDFFAYLNGPIQASLTVPFATFDPTDTHILTPQASIPCDIDFCSVTWSA